MPPSRARRPRLPAPAPASAASATSRTFGHVTSRGPRQAQLDGFDLHANIWVPPNNRARLEQLCRYLLRPPLAQDRVRLRPDGRVFVELKTAWRDGTSHFLFEPIEFLEKLAALIPRPVVNLLLYHGVLAPRARWRSQVVRYGRPAPDSPTLELEARICNEMGQWLYAPPQQRPSDDRPASEHAALGAQDISRAGGAV